MSSANFKPKRTAAASRGFLATAWLSCYIRLKKVVSGLYEIDVAENDGDSRFWTGSINYTDSAHVQRRKWLNVRVGA